MPLVRSGPTIVCSALLMRHQPPGCATKDIYLRVLADKLSAYLYILQRYVYSPQKLQLQSNDRLQGWREYAGNLHVHSWRLVGAASNLKAVHFHSVGPSSGGPGSSVIDRPVGDVSLQTAHFISRAFKAQVTCVSHARGQGC